MDGEVAEVQDPDQQRDEYESLQPAITAGAFREVAEFRGDAQAQKQVENNHT